MNFVIVFLTILAITLIGYLLISIFNLKDEENGISNIALSWGLGVGIVSFQLFTYSRLGIPWTRENLLLFWVPFLIFHLYKRQFKTFKIHFKWKASFKEIFVIFFLLLSLLYTFTQSIIRPMTTWDSWATWLFEAKVFFIDGRVIPQLFREFDSDYPLVFKLLGSFIYVMLGRVDDTAVLLISYAFYIFSGLALFTFINHKFGRKLAILFTFLFLTNQVMIRQGGRLEAGQADLPLAFYELITTIIICAYFTGKKIELVIVANIFLGIMCLVKQEGIPYAVVSEIFIIYFILKNKLSSHLWTIFLWIIPLADWYIFRLLNNLGSSYWFGHPIQFSKTKTLNALSGTFGELINIKSWGLSWILYGFSFVVFKRKSKIDTLFLNSQILTQLGIYLALYIFTFGNYPNSSIERLLVHLYPLIFIYFALEGKTITYKFPKIL